MSALAASAGPQLIITGDISGDGLTASGIINSTPFSYTLTISSPPKADFGVGRTITGGQWAGNWIVRGSTTAFGSFSSTYQLNGLPLNNGSSFTSGTEASADNYLCFYATGSGCDAIAQFDFSSATPKISAFVYDPAGGNIDISSGIGNVVANATSASVPEPSTYALGGLALVGMFFARRRQA